jgi:hypothetical protein
MLQIVTQGDAVWYVGSALVPSACVEHHAVRRCAVRLAGPAIAAGTANYKPGRLNVHKQHSRTGQGGSQATAALPCSLIIQY